MRGSRIGASCLRCLVILLSLHCSIILAAVSQIPGTVAQTTRAIGAHADVKATFGQLPLYFIENQGQIDERVKFYEKGSGHATYFTRSSVYFLLEKAKDPQNPKESEAVPKPSIAVQPSNPVQIRLVALGANKHVTVLAEKPTEGKVNYFIGNDSKKWKTNIPTYQAVAYRDIYPGVDLKFYGNDRQMEYDLVVKPGADPSRIKLAYEGIEGLHISKNGDLEIALKGGIVVQKKPVAYQEINGKRVAVPARFKVEQRQARGLSYGFEVASYDKRYLLFVDPTLVYSTYLGGNSMDEGRGIAVDSSGNAYVTGWTAFNFPTVNAIRATNSGGGDDAFVTKLNATGTGMVYSTYLGGSSGDEGYGIAVDGSGNAYVTGFTGSSDFPTVNALQTTNNGSADIFITKINPTGSALVYSTYLGGANFDEGFSIAIDSYGNAYVTGYTQSLDFPTNTLQTTTYNNNGHADDAFATKLNSTGSGLVYSTYLAGFSGGESGRAIAVDGFGNAYVTGVTNSTDFPSVNAFQPGLGGSNDAFVVKLDATGSAFVYSTFLGGSGSDEGDGIAVDSAGNAYITGQTTSTNFPLANALQLTYGGGGDAFVAELNSTGSTLSYSTYLGGSGIDAGNDIKVDGAGNLHLTGETTSSNFPTANAIESTYGGGYDAFVTEINAAGSALVYSTYLGGGGDDYGEGIALWGGNDYVAGVTGSTDFPTSHAIQSTFGGTFWDAFVAKIDPTLIPAITTLSLPIGTEGVAYNQTLTAVGGTTPYSWSISGGGFPPGLTFSTDGVISGTPTTSGSFRFTVEVTDATSNKASRVLLITIPAPLSIPTSTLPGGTPGTSYSTALSATGGYPPYTWALFSGGLPTGLTLDSSGTISGTPTTPGSYGFTVQVTDSASSTATQALSITIASSLSVTSPATLPGATQGTAYSYTLAATGGQTPYAWSLLSGSLPPGLTLSSSGVILGTPSAIGTYSFTAQVTDAASVTATQPFSITVANPLSITTTLLANGSQGSAYSQALVASGGTPPYAWSLVSGSLPTGLTLSSGGVISGTPSVAGTFNFTAQVVDANSLSNTKALTVTINVPGNTPVGTNVQVPLGTVSPTFSQVTVAGNTTTTASTTAPGGITPVGFTVPATYQYNDIVTTATYTGNITVCLPYNDGGLTPLQEQHLHLLHLPSLATAWVDITTTRDPLNNVICGVTSNLSPFIIVLESSTAVTVTTFQASRSASGAELVWVTEAETDNLGFKVLRSDSPNGPYLPLSNAQIPARGGLGMTMTYNFTDSSAEVGKTYYYKLEDISYTGTIGTVGPVVLDAGVSAAQVASTTGTTQPTQTTSSRAQGYSASSRPATTGAVTPIALFPSAATAASGQMTTAESAQTAAVAQVRPSMTAPTPTQPASNTTRASSDGNVGVETVSDSAAPPLPVDDQPLQFSVAITDARGNLITVSREEGTSRASEVTPLTVEWGRQVVVSWTAQHVPARGFMLLRRVKGQRGYEKAVPYIPNFALDADGTYRYRIVDATAKPGTRYEYMRVSQDWGVQVGVAKTVK